MNPHSDAPFFYGRSENRLNSKGQVALPKAFRSVLDEAILQERFVLVPGEQACVYMYTHRQFSAVRAAVRAFAHEENDPEFFRAFMEEAESVELDTQGRLVLPRRLRAYAGIEGPDVAFIGMDDRIEIWAPEAREAVRGSADAYRERRGVHARRFFGL